MWTVRKWKENDERLVTVYPGVVESAKPERIFDSAVDAAECAIKVAVEWQKKVSGVCIGADILIGKYGLTAPCFLSIDYCDVVNEGTFGELRTWAKALDEKLPKCDHCGVVIYGEVKYTNSEDDEVYCSDSCREERHDFFQPEDIHCAKCGALADFDTSELEDEDEYFCYECEESEEEQINE